MGKKTYTEEILKRSRKDSRLPSKDFGKSAYEMYCVPVGMYEKYKDDVLKLSLSFQKWFAPKDGRVVLERMDQLSDGEIAEKLGLDEDMVRKIRCMAEWDIPMEVWRNAAEFKRRHRLELPLGCPDRDIKGEPSQFDTSFKPRGVKNETRAKKAMSDLRQKRKIKFRRDILTSERR